MGYLNENGLARYDGLVKQWVTLKSGTVDGIDPLLNWQKTADAGAVTCYPIPASPLEPNVSFMFTETPPSSGDKSPSNPSTITGVNSVKVTRCGKNIIQYPFYETTRTRNGITFTDNGDGSVTANGTATDYTQFALINPYWNTGGGKLLPVGTYRLSGCPAGGNWNTYKLRVVFSSNYSDYVTAPSDTGSGSTVTVTKASIVSWMIEISSGTTVSNIVFKPQLELGSTATAFEPYDGADYTVNLGGTYYGGNVDLSTGTMTVSVGGSAISTFSSATVNINTIMFGALGSYVHGGNITPSVCACNRLAFATGNTDTEHWRQAGYHGDAGYVFFLNKSRLDVSEAIDPSNPTNAEWLAAGNAWLVDNPIFVASSLATPYTVPLIPTQIYSLSQPDPYTLRINTVYSDQTSVQVGYPKSPLATSTELTNAIISLGGNI